MENTNRSCHILFILSKPSMEHEDVTRRIIGCAMRVHDVLGPGYLEAVYQNALAYELRRNAQLVEREKPIEVHYDGVLVGTYAADLFVGGCVLVETKAVRALVVAHDVQLVHYLTATRVEIGVLLNFGAERLQFRRKFRTYRPSQDHHDG